MWLFSFALFNFLWESIYLHITINHVQKCTHWILYDNWFLPPGQLSCPRFYFIFLINTLKYCALTALVLLYLNFCIALWQALILLFLNPLVDNVYLNWCQGASFLYFIYAIMPSLDFGIQFCLLQSFYIFSLIFFTPFLWKTRNSACNFWRLTLPGDLLFIVTDYCCNH